jgi:copper resistance protein C
MKSRLWIGSLFCIIMLLFSTPAFAHTKLVQTLPSNGEKVTEAKEIKLTFTENILPVSTFEVKNDHNETIPLNPISAKGKELTGVPLTPLPKNHYTVQWKAAAEDGHVSEGSFSFDVQASSTKSPDINKPIENSEKAPAVDVPEQTSHSNTWVGFLAGAIVILVGVFFFSLKGKNRK